MITHQPKTGSASLRVATREEIAARPVEHGPSLAKRSTAAFLAVLTVLAHGAAVVSFGLAMGIGFRRRGWAVAASVGLFLFVTVVWPLVYGLCFYPPDAQVQHVYPWGPAMASPVPTIAVLLVHMRFDDAIAEIIRWATFWDVFFLLIAAAVAALTIGVLVRRSRAYRLSGQEVESERPAVALLKEPALRSTDCRHPVTQAGQEDGWLGSEPASAGASPK